MTLNGTVNGTTGLTRLLCHAALWFGLVFATPLFVALYNVEGTGLEPGRVALYAALLALTATFLSFLLTSLLPKSLRKPADSLVLVLAIVLAIWGNGIHDLLEFGVFDGRPIDFREHEALFWLEGLAWFGGALVLFRLIGKRHAIPLWLPALPIVSFCLLLAPALANPPQQGLEVVKQDAVNDSVYDFSSIANLVHLLPDGFQGDTVRRALEENPGLAARLEGFTLFTDHLGRYPGTAPSLYAMLTGKPFPLERGFSYSWVGPETRSSSYQNELAQEGFQVDLVPISNYICPENANSCHPRPFKNSGYAVDREKSLRYSVSLLADLSLFRLAPLFLKERIYDKGYWLLSEIAADQGAPVPDPILREWAAKMRVVDDRPVYKWYHYVGTHVPPHRDASCNLKRNLEAVPANYVAQAHCILEGIAGFVDALKSAGIYDRTAVIVSGDHGHNTVPADQLGHPFNFGMYAPLLGTGRPAMLVKAPGAKGTLRFNNAPTDLLNIAPTARSLAGLPANGPTVFDVTAVTGRDRKFQHYQIGPFWSGNPVPYLEYEVRHPANKAIHWAIADMAGYGSARSEYRPVNKKTAKGLIYGAELRSTIGKNRWSWVRGRQLAFLIETPSSTRDGTLNIELAFEPWMEQQAFEVSLNGNRVLHQAPMPVEKLDSEFRTWQIPIKAADLREGPEFVSLVFDQTYLAPGSENSRASARIRKLNFSPQQ